MRIIRSVRVFPDQKSRGPGSHGELQIPWWLPHIVQDLSDQLVCMTSAVVKEVPLRLLIFVGFCLFCFWQHWECSEVTRGPTLHNNSLEEGPMVCWELNQRCPVLGRHATIVLFSRPPRF